MGDFITHDMSFPRMRESRENTGSPIKALGHDNPLAQTIDLLLSHQRSDGYWWYTLEANETIGSEFIFLMHYLGEVDLAIQEGIKNRILDVQRADGTWAIYFNGPPEISTTIECYFALRIAGVPQDDENMIKARQYILEHGGIEKCRVFTKIHLAMFGLVPWSSCPEMPSWFIHMPRWFPFNIYEFSSWARATIVPLLIFMTVKRTQKSPNNIMLDELFQNPLKERDYSFRTNKGLISWENAFIYIDKILKILDKIPFHPLRRFSLRRCADWTWRHVEKTEDIYPALAYCALANKALGYSNDSPQIRKPFEALKMFHQVYTTSDVPALPDEIRDSDEGRGTKDERRKGRQFRPTSFVLRPSLDRVRVHQQCCISPVWDTPWAAMALLEAGVPADHPALIRTGRWLLGKQIRETRGDWSIKNANAPPGGWAFEFENDFFPDVDDTIEVLSVLNRIAIPESEKAEAIVRGNEWLLSMQNDDGGWGAFDKNQTQNLVNRIPFADHKACLDPSTPDIAGRAIEYLVTYGCHCEERSDEAIPIDAMNSRDRFVVDTPPRDDTRAIISRALNFIWSMQEDFGGWFGRWGINYIYGTWNVLMGLSALGIDPLDGRMSKAMDWLESIQRTDGGWSESPLTYDTKKFSGYGVSVPSQTAWALMGLVAGGRARGNAATRGAQYLLDSRNSSGGWDERHYTGTGFEGHFYIRYHGYRHFFPLLALGRYFKAL